MMDKSETRLLHTLHAELKDELLTDILPYWINHTIDRKKGGFYGRITFSNVPILNANKGALLTARVLWTFSACYNAFNKAEYKEVADHAYQYLTEVCLDKQFGGVFWMTSADAIPTDTRKFVYAQAFAIYALTEYFNATGSEAALDLAKELFQILETKCADPENGGYFEAFSYNWKVLDDVRLSDKDENEPKSMNTHLHVLEAYTNLYRYWKPDDLKRKLESLIDIFADHIINKNNYTATAFFDEDWKPKSTHHSFGHDIESSWLLTEAADVLGDYSRYEELREICLNMAHQVKQDGLDADGGILNEADTNGITDENKDWWPQAEGVVGFLNAFQLSGNTGYLQSAAQVWEFIKGYVIDKERGEWHEKVNREGIPFELEKVRAWKCPYHNGRTALEVMVRTKQLLDSDSLVSEGGLSEDSSGNNTA